METEQEKLVNSCFEYWKKEIKCATGGNKSCWKCCAEHSDLLMITMKGILMDTPKWKESLQGCRKGAEMCADHCSSHEESHCKDCAQSARKFLEETRGFHIPM